MSIIQRLKNHYRSIVASLQLANKSSCDLITDNLQKELSTAVLDNIFLNDDIENKWHDVRIAIESLHLPEGMDGVNLGDQKALFFLINHFKPLSVLEIGTHIGCSTVHIASALKGVWGDSNITFNTVDIRDVNDNHTKPWLSFKSPNSPVENLNKLGIGFVKFYTKSSIDYLRSCDQQYDFIFLDGLHEAGTLFEELPLALRILKKDGLVLLHDYFPNNEPLWSDRNLIPGPYLAVRKFQQKNKKLVVLPLGNLPWYTKLGSNMTSLAICFGKKN